MDLAVIKNPRVLYLASINLLYAVGLYGMTFFLSEVASQLQPSYSATNIGLDGWIPYIFGAV